MSRFMNKTTLKRAAAAVAFLVTVTGVSVPRVEAMMVPVSVAHQDVAVRRTDMAKIESALENKIVRHRLAELGLSTDQINDRLARLPSDQLHQVAMQADKQQAAGDAGGTVLIVIAAIALLALIISLLKNVAPHDHVVRDDHDRREIETTQPATVPAAPPATAAPQPDQKTIIVK